MKKILFCFLFFSIISITAALRGFNGVERGSKNLITDQEYFETLAPSPSPSPQKVVLARRRTQRPDILQGFKRYKGGWDLTNRHYWASVGFTGLAGFVPAFIFFVSFGILVVVRCCYWQAIQDISTNWLLRACVVLLIVSTCASMIGCIFLAVDQEEFRNEVFRTLNYVVNQSDQSVHTLRNVSTYLAQAKGINVNQFVIPSDVQDRIDRLNKDLGPAADSLEKATFVNSSQLKNVLKLMQLVLILDAVVMVFVAFLGLVLSLHGHRRAVNICIFNGWLLVPVTFILFGVFLVLNNAITDTCIAMEEWVNNSQAKTTLSNMLPCVDQRMTNKTLIQSKEVINDVVTIVNVALSYYADSNPSLLANQSDQKIPLLCSPFDTCHSQEVTFANASLVWQHYICIGTTCDTAWGIPSQTYLQLVGAVSVSSALYEYAPPLLSFQDCEFVKATFKTITSNYCSPLEHHTHLVSVDLCVISIAVLLCVIIWILFGNLQSEELFLKHHSHSEKL
ncbi:envelope glycoprotein B [Thalictrum thalictroides]|uniref:Envelope glycoprotein B n=1 Tax=Thalictrum thalictroides TaxID=46969 RepID=A0A7J6WCZ9_THATH|nr:envelope glycoprotein B [Thalictrum thalictroides]